MSEAAQRTVEMFLIQPGAAAPNGEFTFEMQPRTNSSRTVKFALSPSDAHDLKKALEEYFKVQR